LQHYQIINYHLFTALDEQSKEKCWTITCVKCDKTFYKRIRCTEHYQEEHGGLDDGEKIYKCNKCDKRFNSSVHVREHFHQHDDIKYTCPVCNKDFHSPNNLRKHMVMVHQKSMPKKKEESELFYFPKYFLYH
jgi:DNA-directed RNA polymerase subunit RPC12/RpoP